MGRYGHAQSYMHFVSFRLSDENGPLEFTLVSEGVIPRNGLDPMDGL